MTTWIHKRVPHSMVTEYTAKGWTIWKREDSTVLLVWKRGGLPP